MSSLILAFVYTVDPSAVYLRKIRRIVQNIRQHYSKENIKTYIENYREKEIEEKQLQKQRCSSEYPNIYLAQPAQRLYPAVASQRYRKTQRKRYS